MATAEIRHVSTASSLTPSCGFAAQRLRSANPFFRSSPPSMPHYHAAGGRRSIARYARASGGQGYVQHHFRNRALIYTTNPSECL